MTNNPYADVLKKHDVALAFGLDEHDYNIVKQALEANAKLHEQAEMVKAGELLPCPFCGDEAQLMTDELNFDCLKGTVMCMSCYATSTDQKSDNWKEAITAWNTRAVLKDLEV